MRTMLLAAALILLCDSSVLAQKEGDRIMSVDGKTCAGTDLEMRAGFDREDGASGNGLDVEFLYFVSFASRILKTVSFLVLFPGGVLDWMATVWFAF